MLLFTQCISTISRAPELTLLIVGVRGQRFFSSTIKPFTPFDKSILLVLKKMLIVLLNQSFEDQ